MQPQVAICLLLAAAPCGASALRLATVDGAAAAERNAAEAEDRRFWAPLLSSMELELQQLQAMSSSPAKGMSSLQLAAAPSTGKKAAATKPAAKAEAAATKPAVAKPAAKAESTKPAAKAPAAPSVDMSKIAAMAGLGERAKGNPAALAPMLAMLKGLYESGRDRIAEMNKREKQSKARFAGFEKEHEKKLAHIQQELKDHKISAEFAKNSTESENRLYAYWPRCREREHRQFHNMLKIQHATMEKEKMMIDMYEKTMKGAATQEVQRKLAQVSQQVPEVVLSQVQASVSHFCKEALVEVAQARGELLEVRAPVRGA